MNKQSEKAERAKDKERIDAQAQKKSDEDRMVSEYRKQQQDLYRQALDQQVSLICNKGIEC